MPDDQKQSKIEALSEETPIKLKHVIAIVGIMASVIGVFAAVNHEATGAKSDAAGALARANEAYSKAEQGQNKYEEDHKQILIMYGEIQESIGELKGQAKARR